MKTNVVFSWLLCGAVAGAVRGQSSMTDDGALHFKPILPPERTVDKLSDLVTVIKKIRSIAPEAASGDRLPAAAQFDSGLGPWTWQLSECTPSMVVRFATNATNFQVKVNRRSVGCIFGSFCVFRRFYVVIQNQQFYTPCAFVQDVSDHIVSNRDEGTSLHVYLCDSGAVWLGPSRICCCCLAAKRIRRRL